MPSSHKRKLSLRCYRHEDVVAQREMISELEPRWYFTALTIAQENALPGTPQSTWYVQGGGDATIQGFATDISVNVGQTVSFKITDTKLASYHVDIYRLGYYQGNGARLVTTIAAAQCLKVNQPKPLTDASTGLIDCGNWSITASWAIPADATSGVYFARVTRDDTKGASLIPFIVRNDASHSAMVFQTADETWEAYNDWGGNSLYVGNPVGRAYKVSYNRPFNNGADHQQDYLFGEEYPMIRFLEQNGYDLSYVAGVDAERNPGTLLNHKIYLSVGHDEYWSGAQRTNVEAARNAGLNLAIFSGNEVYWKTRWENSTDSSHAAYRTLVCYKESLIGTDQVTVSAPVDLQYTGGGVVDPTGIWTGLWRDQNTLNTSETDQLFTGQLFSVNRGANGMFGTAIQVPSTDAMLRIWRNTSVAQLQPGQVATLAQGTLGYEWDEDVDNGQRPAGTIDMSSTTEGVPEKLIDPQSWPNCGGVLGTLCPGCRGCMVAPATATHSITEYRAPGGALVFDAGTVQWSWGLDGTHDGGTTTPDRSMQQATVNLFADMHVQPGTLMAGLVAATASTDTTAPTAVLNAPPGGVITEQGGFATISGTATDAGGGVAGGGVVAGVEVSIDGGKTWHPATGRNDWTYSWAPTGTGPIQIETRAADDSANLSGASANFNATIQAADNSLYLWSNATLPTTMSDPSGAAIEVGMRFKTDVGGTISAVRFYKGAGNTGTHVGHLWSNTGQLLATVTFGAETDTGWQTAYFSTPVQIAANTTYVVSYHTDTGHFAYTANQFAAAPVDHGSLHALASQDDPGGNGLYIYGSSAFPKNTFSGGNYWVDVVFNPNGTAPTVPTVVAQSPRSGSVDVPIASSISAQFNESINSSTLSFVLTDPNGVVVPTSLVYNDTTRTATITPASSLVYGTTYTATVYCSDKAGVPMTTHYNWTFNTIFATAAQSVWPDTATPEVASEDDANSVELGVKIRSDVAGYIRGVRFYKGPTNIGTHTGSVWSSTGTLLATGTFTNETDSGWQTLIFTNAVPVAANTTYVVSYHAPNGGYSETDNYFIGATIGTGTLHALADGTDGHDGVFKYGSSSAFPNQSETPAGENYWVDALFTYSQNDITPPTVLTTTPSAGAFGAAVNAPLTAQFSEDVALSTLSFVLKDSSGNVVPSYLTYNSTTHVATLTPASSLLTSTVYTATVSAVDPSGNPMKSPLTWSFTTAAPLGQGPFSLFGSGSAPQTADDSDTASSEVGVRFRSDVAGQIVAIRFYKGPTNTGVHVGDLWTSTGTLLATGTFTNETASGWQTLTLSTPVNIAANTTYVASYHTNVGSYAEDDNVFTSAGIDNGPLHALKAGVDGANGVYSYGPAGTFPTQTWLSANYWVDVVLSTSDTTAPTVTAKSPAAGATGVATNTTVTATFSESIQPSSLTFTLKDAGGNTVAATVAYNDATHTATLTPTGLLTGGVTYTATVSGAKDAAGNVLASPVTWTFTTLVPDTTPPSVTGQSPAAGATNVPQSTTVSVTFSESVQSATIAFTLKDAGGNAVAGTLAYNDATHTATFTPSTTLNPAATYTASASGAKDLAGNVMVGSATWSFTTTAPDTTPPSVTGAAPAAGATGVGTGTAVAVTFSEAIQPATLTFTLKDAGGNLVAAPPFVYNSSTFTATLTPTAALANGTTYIVTVSGAKDLAGNAMPAPVSWSFTTVPDTTPPVAIPQSPAPGSSGVDLATTVSATFNEPVQSTTIAFTLQDGAGNTVAATLAYNSTTGVATLTPSAPLAGATTYTATVSGAKDLAGNVMSPLSWSFTTAVPLGGGPFSIWGPSAAPTLPDDADTGSVEVGVKFQSDVSGYVTGIRFYKGATNTGTHTGSLWSSTGTLLATGTFVNETATGWQQLNFATPIAITAGTTYVASYHAPVGQYAADNEFFGTAGVDNGPLHALSDAAGGGNGVYVYGATTKFPSSSYQGTNYWVDVVFAKNYLLQTTAADFNGGAASGTEVTSDAGGEVQLTPSFQDDFNGSTLGSSWTKSALGTGTSTATLSGGVLSLGSAQILGGVTTAPVEARLTIAAAASQYFGVATSLSAAAGNYWAAFTTSTTTNSLYGQVNLNGTLTTTKISALLTGYHVYRVQPTSTGAQFWIDGVLKLTIAKVIPATASLKIALGATAATPAMQADWARVDAYTSGGTFVSSVLDAGRVALWGSAQFTASLPAGTSLLIETSSGNTATPDGTWSAWSALGPGNVVQSPSARYLRYRITLVTTDPTQTATLSDILFSWS